MRALGVGLCSLVCSFVANAQPVSVPVLMPDGGSLPIRYSMPRLVAGGELWAVESVASSIAWRVSDAGVSPLALSPMPSTDYAAFDPISGHVFYATVMGANTGVVRAGGIDGGSEQLPFMLGTIPLEDQFVSTPLGVFFSTQPRDGGFDPELLLYSGTTPARVLSRCVYGRFRVLSPTQVVFLGCASASPSIEPWVTDGTLAGTRQLRTAGAAPTLPMTELVVGGGSAWGCDGTRLYRVTASGAMTVVGAPNQPAGYLGCSTLTGHPNGVVFRNAGLSNLTTLEWWTSDGVNTHFLAKSPTDIGNLMARTSWGSRFVWATIKFSPLSMLWMTDSAADGGARLVSDHVAPSPDAIVAVPGGQLFFGTGLDVSMLDRFDAGVSFVGASGSAQSQHLALVGKRIYFSADTTLRVFDVERDDNAQNGGGSAGTGGGSGTGGGAVATGGGSGGGGGETPKGCGCGATEPTAFLLLALFVLRRCTRR